VHFFTFFGLTIPLLSFAARLPVSSPATLITAIGLPPPARSAYKKAGVTPATNNMNEFQNPALKIAGV